MRLRSITFGRGIVLLILGIAIGTGLFLQSRLSPETLRDQVVAVLNEKFAMPVELDEEQVEIQLKHGLVIHDFVIPYPKGAGTPGDAIRVAVRVILACGFVLANRIAAGSLRIQQRPASRHANRPRLRMEEAFHNDPSLGRRKH